jgi:hypothetical protein
MFKNAELQNNKSLLVKVKGDTVRVHVQLYCMILGQGSGQYQWLNTILCPCVQNTTTTMDFDYPMTDSWVV